MNIKVQGGGSGKYANTGSSYGCMNYFNHENEQRISEGKQLEPFFNGNGEGEDMEFSDMVEDMDNNKAKLSKKDAKFYVLTVSPSQREQSAMGETEAERSANFKKYINTQLMEKYANNFNKGLTAKDIKYYGKIHHNREREKNKEGSQMHAHIIVSRKSKNNKVKLSPKTNHRNVQRSGTVKSGFDRFNFFQESERAFDKEMNFDRSFKERFEYQNALKNGTSHEKFSAMEKAEVWEREQMKERFQEQIKEREQKRQAQLEQIKEQSRARQKGSKTEYFGRQ